MTHWDIASAAMIGIAMGACAFLGYLAAGVIY